MVVKRSFTTKQSGSFAGHGVPKQELGNEGEKQELGTEKEQEDHMSLPYQPMNAVDVLDLYFMENRARILDIASFLDRIDRHEGAEQARKDFRYQALIGALALLSSESAGRTGAIQLSFSDPTTEPIESAVGLKAVGAWDGGTR